MAKKRQHPLDTAAEKLVARAKEPTKQQADSESVFELHFCSDAKSCGDYPQVVFANPSEYDDSVGLTISGFPKRHAFEQKVQRRAKWTDVLSSQLWSEGMLMTYDSAEVFKTANLGNYREYNVTVLDRDSKPWSLCYLFFKNTIPLAAIDYERSSFLLVDIVSEPIRKIQLKSKDDFERTMVMAREGTLKGCDRFSRIAPKRVLLDSQSTPDTDIFRFARFGPPFYATKRLCDLIESHNLSGLDICENRILEL